MLAYFRSYIYIYIHTTACIHIYLHVTYIYVGFIYRQFIMQSCRIICRGIISLVCLLFTRRPTEQLQYQTILFFFPSLYLSLSLSLSLFLSLLLLPLSFQSTIIEFLLCVSHLIFLHLICEN